MAHLFHLLIIIAALLAIPSCDDTQPTPPTADHNLITTVVLTLVGQNSDTVRATWHDNDGTVGSLPSTTQTLTLRPSTFYKGTVQVYSDGLLSKKDLTPSIAKENSKHQFLYSDDKGLVVFAVTDSDSSGKLVGLSYNAYTSKSTGQGTMKVALYHYADPALKVSRDPGQTVDVIASFPIVVSE